MGFGQGDSIATPHLIDVGVDEGIVVVQIDIVDAGQILQPLDALQLVMGEVDKGELAVGGEGWDSGQLVVAEVQVNQLRLHGAGQADGAD